MFAFLYLLSLTVASASPIHLKRQTTTRSPDYSGASLLSSPDGTAINYITAQINVPETKFVAAEGSPGTTQLSTAWVGIGAGHPRSGNGIIQTGCSFFNDGYQDLYTRCWYEFFPAKAQYFDGFSPNTDDTLLLEITRVNPTTGHAAITNLNTGEAVSTDFPAPDDGTASTGPDADWVVENPQGTNNFADFQVQFFEGCSATTEGGEYVWA